MGDPVLNSPLAWSLLVAAARQGLADSQPTRLQVPDCPALTLQAAPDGRWEAQCMIGEEASQLLDLYLPLCVRPRGGLACAQTAQTLDGYTATQGGASHYITGADERVHLHRLRALCDAVVVGAGTALADDPQLTVRHVEGPNPVRVVIDPSGRVSADRRLYQDALAPTLHVYDPARCPASRRPPLPGVERVPVAGGAEGMTPASILAALAERGLERVLVEGGADTVSRFLAAGALNRLLVSVAPMILGSGRRSFQLAGVEHLDQALRPPCRRFMLGDDVLFDFRLERARPAS